MSSIQPHGGVGVKAAAHLPASRSHPEPLAPILTGDELPAEARRELGDDAADDTTMKRSFADLVDAMTPTTATGSQGTSAFSAAVAEESVDVGSPARGGTSPASEKSAAGMSLPNLLANVPYTAACVWNQSLDIYLPPPNAARRDGPPGATTNTTAGAPVVIHVHGGGWSRGDRTYNFYGAPKLCSAYAQMGYFAVAIGYRLGNFANFMEDVATAVRWVVENIATLEGCERADPTRIVLSGHSAGAHIVALLLTNPAFLEAAGGVNWSHLRGAVLISGIYTVRNPFSSNVSTVQNWGFQKLYVKRAFVERDGTTPVDLNEASPAWRVAQLAASDDAVETLRKETTKNACHCSIRAFFSKTADTTTTAAARRLPSFPVPPLLSIPTVILCAESDLNLDYDSKKLHSLLSEVRRTGGGGGGGSRRPHHAATASPLLPPREGGDAKAAELGRFYRVSGTSHPTICNLDVTHGILAHELSRMLLIPAAEEASSSTATTVAAGDGGAAAAREPTAAA